MKHQEANSKDPKDKAASAKPPADGSELAQQVEELTSALQRERADAANLRRRHQDEMSGLRQHVKADVVRELLPIIDNFELSLQHKPDKLADDPFVKGVDAIVKQFAATLKQIGVERIATVGQPFDPNLHEAVGTEQGEGASDTISQELRAGYRLGDDVLRHAMVKVWA